MKASDVRRKIESIPYEKLPGAIAVLEYARSLAVARLTVRPIAETAPVEPVLLSVVDAAKIVNLQPVALRRSARFKSARRKLGERTLRYDKQVLIRLAGRA